MAVNEPRVFHPKLPTHIERDHIRFHFDRISDSLIVFFHYPPARGTVYVPTGEFEYLGVDAETEDVTGFMVEALLSRAIYTDWSYLQYAALAGIDREEIAHLRERVEAAQSREDEEEQRLRLVQHWIGHAGVLQRYG